MQIEWFIVGFYYKARISDPLENGLHYFIELGECNVLDTKFIYLLSESKHFLQKVKLLLISWLIVIVFGNNNISWLFKFFTLIDIPHTPVFKRFSFFNCNIKILDLYHIHFQFCSFFRKFQEFLHTNKFFPFFQLLQGFLNVNLVLIGF